MTTLKQIILTNPKSQFEPINEYIKRINNIWLQQKHKESDKIYAEAFYIELLKELK